MKINLYTVLGFVFITIVTTMAYSEVGKVNCVSPYSIYDGSLVFAVLAIMGLPFALGYLWGRDQE